MGLTNKNKLFIQEYIKNNYTNATEAYMKVYEGNQETARVQACRVLKKPEAIEYLQEVQRQAYQEAGITAERIACQLADLAFKNEGDELYGSSSQMKALDLLQKQLSLQTQKVDVDTSNIQIEVKIEE